ncbi:MAG: TonB-dependent receptor, partial [Pseudomonadales bacterium]|nr:TonB-dependent receptor [Pseudomonadales bacterium]
HTAVTYHGQSDGLSRRMQVLIDGRVALGTLFGIVDWDRLGITVDDIERIEVVRGPAGVAYGSNAFIGAINIVTREPFANPGWRFSSANGSRDTELFNAQYAHSSDKFDYRGSFSYFNTDGFAGVNDESRSRSGRFQGRYQVDSSALLDFQLGYAEGPWGRGAIGIPIDPVGEKEAKEQYANIRFTRSSSPGNEWYIQLGASESSEEDRVDAGLLSGLIGVSPSQVPLLVDGQVDQMITVRVFDYVSSRVDAEFQQQLLLGVNIRAVWGVGYRLDDVNGLPMIGLREKESVETYRVQGNFELKVFESVLFNAGVMYEDNGLNGAEISPRLGLNYSVADNHVLRLSVAESSRQPFIAEAFHDSSVRFNDGSVLDQVQLSLEVLEPEELLSYELGYIGSLFRGRLDVDVKLFREEFDNEIEFIANPLYSEAISLFNTGAILNFNGGATEITGAELGFKWQVSNNTRVWGSYAYAEADQHCQPMAFRCFASSDATPKVTGSLLISHSFGDDWQISAGYYYLGEMTWIFWGCDAALDCDTPSYDRVDVRLAKTLRLPKADLKLELIGQNLGADYIEFNKRNVFETRAFVRASLQFH